MSDHDPSAGSLARTPLHAWHVEHGARMVPFGGYDMPVQYPTGIIAEHMATRRRAGAFDVSHMGRLRVRGDGAVGFLSRALTCNVAALQPGEARYGFIATPTGGAVDDAYLYMLAPADYLLVINAANRAKDRAWLDELPSDGASIEDQSDALAMISLQGPHAQAIMETMTDLAALPENKRNQLSTCRVDGSDVIVARTGYTGEPVCFELFPPSDDAPALWQRCIDAGASPVGLGARDSLRLEAGLPLYGHELGEAPDGSEIPVFANDLARFAVRTGNGYVGHEAIARQRDEHTRIKRGEMAGGWRPSVLTKLVQPLAVFEGRRPLRAGYRVHLDGEPVGWVTSGTTVPYARFEGTDVTAVPSEEQALRPIGLALVDAGVRYRADRQLVFEIEDDRGKRFEAELVERNLWSLAPFGRPHTGFEAWAPPRQVAAGDVHARAGALGRSAARNHGWRRTECINLIPSEQCTSAFVDGLSISDPAGRYNEHKSMRALGVNAPDVRYYKGTAYSMEKEEELVAALATFFDCPRVEPRVISGQMANDTVYDALVQFRNRHRRGREPQRLSRVLVHDLNRGGHLSAQTMGALKNYVAMDPRTERPAVEHFAYREDNPHAIDAQATCAIIERTRPDLIVFGRSVIIHREPVAAIAGFVHEHFGADDPTRPLIMFDGAHVLGLIGEHYQRPLHEGADVITGSTHKSFFGPQRGVILSNVVPGHPFEDFWKHVESRAFPGHVSNHHLGTLLGLLGATYEMLAFKDEYPRQVIANARALAGALAEQGLGIEGDPALGYTETHQVLLRAARGQGERIATRLEANGIITNPQAFWDDASFAAASGVRMGSQEMTRYGMREGDFAELATLIGRVVRDGGDHAGQVRAFRERFVRMHYCLEDSGG
jgi:aminomethyltransferase